MTAPKDPNPGLTCKDRGNTFFCMNSIDLENELNEMADREVKRDPRPPWERGSAPE